MNPRFRRLDADQRAVATAFSGHPYLTVTPVGPSPPARYQVVYRVPSLILTADNSLERTNMVVVDIVLPAGYPREKPYCTTTSKIFHPNFGNYICIADFWSPSNSIVDVIIEIGDLLQYRLYNTRSPLNAVAAKWVVENLDAIPIGSFELLPVEPEIFLSGSDVRTPEALTTAPSINKLRGTGYRPEPTR